MNLINLVIDSKLQVETKDIEVNENVVVANYIINEKIISKYIIVHANEELISEISINDEKLRNIEERYLEKIFFNIEGDLSWNLYLVFVLKSEEYEKLYLKDKYIIERSERFAKKIIVSETEFNKYIPVGQVVNNRNSEKFIDPIDEWNSELEKYKLQFCLYPFSKVKMENYLKDEVESKDESNKEIEANESIVNSDNITIDYLQIGKGFREHCFSPNTKLSFGTVNLLCGSNGSGKTSVLEAIELTITGQIKKSSQNNYESEIYERDKNSDCKLAFENGEVIGIPSTTREMKRRESYYYQNKEKKISKLNSAFHRYNYYSYEDTFAFCYLDEQPNYNDEFSKIIFGESAKTLEKNFNRFKQEFVMQLKNINKEIESFEKQRDAINNIEIALDISFSLEPINILLDEVGIKYEKIPTNSEYEDIKKWLNNQNIVLKTLRVELSNVIKRIDANSKSDIQQIYNSKLEKEKNLSDKLDSINKIISLYHNNVNDLTKSLKIINNNKKSLEDLNSKLIEEKKVFNENTLIYNNVEKANGALELKQNLDIKRNILRKLEYIKSKWEDIVVPGRIESFDLKEIQSKIEKVGYELGRDNFEVEGIIEDIESEKRKKTTVSKIIGQIKALGSHYAELSPESKTCPLCGKDHNSTKEFIERIESDILFDELNFKMLFKRKKILDDQLEINRKELENLHMQNKYLNDLKRATLFISKNFLLGYEFNVEGMEYSEMYTKLFDTLNVLSIEHTALEDIEKKISYLELEGINYESSYRALQFINDKLKINKNFLDENSIKELEQYYKEQYKSIEDSFFQINNQLVEEKNTLEINQREIKGQNDIKEIMEATLIQISKEKVDIENILEEIENIESSGIFTRYNVPYKKLIGYIDDILKELDISIATIDKNIGYRSRLYQVNKLEKQILKYNNFKEKCITVIEKLNNLKSLDKYCDEFIRSNIDEISDLFTSLHSQREFEKLSLDKNGKIIGYRIKNKNKNKDYELPVPIFMMSTGQRTAVVLSIFIRLHIIMKSAPNFILLDEPVANIDDLNILALLDFFKEICSFNKTQIFFTTANEGVARLFKRKFSFLEHKFCEFEFVRYGNENTIISKKIYNSNNDAVVNNLKLFGDENSQPTL